MSSSQILSEAAKLLEKYPNIRFVDALTFDLAGNAVGKRYSIEDLENLIKSGLQFCSATMLIDVAGVTHDIADLGFSDGDPDWPATIIPNTLVPVTWGGGNTAQFMFKIEHPNDVKGWWCDPRAILARVVSQLEKLGLKPVVACELEFFLINPPHS